MELIDNVRFSIALSIVEFIASNYLRNSLFFRVSPKNAERYCWRQSMTEPQAGDCGVACNTGVDHGKGSMLRLFSGLRIGARLSGAFLLWR